VARLKGTLQFGVGLPLVLGLVLGLGLFFGGDLIARVVFNKPEMAALMGLSAVLLPAMILNQLLASALQGLRLIHLAVVAEQLSQPTVRAGMVVAFLLLGMGAFGAMLAATLAALVVTLLLAFFLVRALPRSTRAEHGLREPRQMVRFALPVWLSDVVNTLGGNLQVAMLGVMQTATAVGIFAIANQVTMLGSMFHSAVVSSSMPLFAQLSDRHDRDGMEHLYRTTSKWTYAINLPLFLVLVIFPQTILGLFGKGFEGGSAALVVMAFAGLANAGTGTSGAILDMAGYTGLKLVNSGAALGTALLLNLLLIPPLGLVGAAIALTASTATLNLLRLAEVGWLLRLNPYDRSFLKPTGAGLLAVIVALGMAFGVTRLGGHTLLAAVVGIVALGLVYTLALVRLGLSDDDRAVLRGMWQRIRRRGTRGERRTSASVADKPIVEAPR